MAFASNSLRERELLGGGIKSDVTADMLASKAVVVKKNLIVDCVSQGMYPGEWVRYES